MIRRKTILIKYNELLKFLRGNGGKKGGPQEMQVFLEMCMKTKGLKNCVWRV